MVFASGRPFLRYFSWQPPVSFGDSQDHCGFAWGGVVETNGYGGDTLAEPIVRASPN
jgi:hypothetical protein